MRYLVIIHLLVLSCQIVRGQSYEYDKDYEVGKKVYTTGLALRYKTLLIQNKSNVNLTDGFKSFSTLEAQFDQSALVQSVKSVFGAKRLEYLAEHEPRPQFRVWFYFDKSGEVKSVSFAIHKNSNITLEELSQMEEALKEIRFSNYIQGQKQSSTGYYDLTLGFRYKWLLEGRVWKE